MKTVIRRWWMVAALALLTGCGAAAMEKLGPGTVRPRAPGQPSTVAPAAPTPATTHTRADVEFMQEMIVHHTQAVEMTVLVPDRSGSEAIRTLARRIESSQEDEMALMRRWLERRGEEVPGPHAHHDHSMHMPGMISPRQMAQLRASSGEEFDRLFLEFMIVHHEGAIVMVEELFATDGAAQEGDIFQFASHVDSDQRMEIERMRMMLRER